MNIYKHTAIILESFIVSVFLYLASALFLDPMRQILNCYVTCSLTQFRVQHVLLPGVCGWSPPLVSSETSFMSEVSGNLDYHCTSRIL